jgi:hypothetical protein
MNSDEKLVAIAVKDIISKQVSIPNTMQVALATDAEAIQLPNLVILVEFSTEEESTELPKRFKMEITYQMTNAAEDAGVVDEVFRGVSEALCPLQSGPFTYLPGSLTHNFDYFRIENESGSAFKRTANTTSRSRFWWVFARLR